MIFVDGHVHVYSCFDPAVLFTAAWDNFQAHAERLGRGHDYSGVLLLTERNEDNWFSSISAHASEQGREFPGSGEWRVSLTGEDESLVLARNKHESLVVIAGRQLISEEGFEVLALMTSARFEDGLPASSLIGEVSKAGGIPVVPWAFGKWYGSRGRVLQQLCAGKTDRFFLGDNGGRPAVLRMPALMRDAVRKGQKIVSGSDPLPLPGEEHRTGSFGFHVATELDRQTPAAQLRSLAKDTGVIFESYGDPMCFSGFIMNQWLLRRRKC